ncbi:SDR family oxidoreductase [Sphingomonas lenta]|uniref:Short-chain dehydrogenase n=1 Tax=Sphingomonas lenta TaxID=1141887 RepID=A0A2A2SBQ4_9SPHN|nr:SDR family oxidoreductase [Sphingomonas lenta]PAX06687.1 short-chain dehydrogenase [Sphingomonas lenta]
MRRTVLVTGGAKRLGAAIARRLAADGHLVVVHYGRSGAEAEALAAELGGVAVRCDLADAHAVDGLVERAGEAAGAPVDGLVNSASQFEFDRPPEVDAALLDRLMRVNLSAPVRLACAVAERSGDAAVVNLLDQKVANLNPDFFSYSCTKVALAGATPMLAQALGPGCRVNAVSPGLTLASGDQSDGEFGRAAVKNLLRRPVGADAVADAVAFLMNARGVTGQNLFVDCGQRFLPRGGDVMFEDRDG